MSSNNMPWEAGFWGNSGPSPEVAPDVKPAKTARPWEPGFWDGKTSPVKSISPKSIDFKSDKGVREALVIKPNEVMPDTQSVASNIAEIDNEIKNAKSSKQIAILKAARDKLIKQGRL